MYAESFWHSTCKLSEVYEWPADQTALGTQMLEVT